MGTNVSRSAWDQLFRAASQHSRSNKETRSMGEKESNEQVALFTANSVAMQLLLALYCNTCFYPGVNVSGSFF